MTVSKKSVSHSHSTHSPQSAEVATTPEPATPNPTTATPSPASTTVMAAANAAVSLIGQAQSALPLTGGLGGKARSTALRMQMLPSELLTEAANFLAAHGDRYPTFNTQDAQTAAQLEDSLGKVIASASALISRAQGTVLEHRGPAMEQALALYGVLKAQSRTDSTVRDTVARMEPLVNTRKVPHQKKQQRLKAKAKKAAELNAQLSSEASPPATPAAAAAPAAPGASAPPATHS